MTTPNLAAVQSMTPAVLCSMQLPDTDDHAVYTVPPGKSAIVKHGTVCNTGGSAISITVQIVQSGQSADGTHCVISGYSLTAGNTLSLADYLGNACLGDGDAIYVQASVATAVDVVVTGVVNS